MGASGPNASMRSLEPKGVFNVQYYLGKGLQCDMF